DAAVAVAVDAVFQDVCRQELRLADFAMRRAARRGAERAVLHELQRRIELIGEEFRATAVIGERCDGRDGVFLAEEAAEAGFHAPDRQERTGRHAIAAFDALEEGGVLLLQALAAADDR